MPVDSGGGINSVGLHQSHSRVFCTLPSFASVKRPRSHGKIGNSEQSKAILAIDYEQSSPSCVTRIKGEKKWPREILGVRSALHRADYSRPYFFTLKFSRIKGAQTWRLHTKLCKFG